MTYDYVDDFKIIRGWEWGWRGRDWEEGVGISWEGGVGQWDGERVVGNDKKSKSKMNGFVD